MEPIRVGLLNDSFPPLIDGVANAVMNYAEVIEKNYGSALVAAPYYPSFSDDVFPYRVVRYKSVDTTNWVGYRTGYPLDGKAIDRISREPLDILHAHCPITAVMLGRTLRETMNIPMVFTYHTKFDIDIRNAISAKLVQDAAIRALVRNIESCDDVWVVSRGAGENLRSLGYNGEYTVMENGVDVPKGRASEEAVETIRKEYLLTPDVPTFLFVGRMMWYKGIRLTLSALYRLKEAGVPFRMLFVGGGGDFDEIRAYTRDLGLAEQCTFTGPVRDRDRLRAFYSAADLFLFPSTFDTNGLVVREAAAGGVASVLIEGSCAAEGVVNGETGLLIRETPESMAAALMAICQNRQAMRDMGTRAMEELYCSWETSVSRAVERYREVIRGTVTLKRHKLWADDLFYQSIAETYNAMQKVRALYEQAKQPRDALVDQALERRETLLERMPGFLRPPKSGADSDRIDRTK